VGEGDIGEDVGKDGESKGGGFSFPFPLPFPFPSTFTGEAQDRLRRDASLSKVTTEDVRLLLLY